ncbi:Acireductone dioxygenase ARD family [Fimicolochytrium jonesii]|uniref:Acireductone dioxygenase ARD family n=1 Tax=Fimicolochytrium jonesii TaxID=1396493 RepID=UPI0022FDFD16|nr:Acireductone dioxygenase ARD family [Fimicolochytrium jonesii]KAI8819219.1 Acireductone dioxygenase ARD family [Fimicolochytrium jonesii]
MVSAYFYNDLDTTDGRNPHQYTPNRPVSLDQLAALGVLHWHLDVKSEGYMDVVEGICVERAYKNRDEITISREKLPNYEEKLKTFFTEHIHEDEEIRFILEGSGYFDIRAPNDAWIRIKCEQGDMIILPAGMYHRFTLDTTNYLKAMRLFKEDPKWTPLNRNPDTDANSYRTNYLNTVAYPASERFAAEVN